jgi:hypothetical protein
MFLALTTKVYTTPGNNPVTVSEVVVIPLVKIV